MSSFINQQQHKPPNITKPHNIPPSPPSTSPSNYLNPTTQTEHSFNQNSSSWTNISLFSTTLPPLCPPKTTNQKHNTSLCSYSQKLKQPPFIISWQQSNRKRSKEKTKREIKQSEAKKPPRAITVVSIRIRKVDVHVFFLLYLFSAFCFFCVGE